MAISTTSAVERIRYLTTAEIDRFFGVIDDARNLAIFRVMYHRGLRSSEIGLLQLSDWDVSADRLIVHRKKHSRGGEHHLTKKEVAALRAWLKVRGSMPGPLFPSRLGRPISQPMLDRLMKRYGRLSGIPPDKRHCHALKHSCATHLLERGESIEDVQDHLGHVNIQNTLIYAKFTNARRQARDRRLRDW